MVFDSTFEHIVSRTTQGGSPTNVDLEAMEKLANSAEAKPRLGERIRLGSLVHKMAGDGS